MLNFGNKEFRNLQEQVLKNAQDIETLKGRENLQVVIVNELPEVGNPNYIYLLAKDDGESPDVYDEYIWLEDEERYEKIGGVSIDLSNYVTKDTEQTITGEKRFTEQINFGTVEAPYQFNFKFLPQYGRMRLNSILNSNNTETELIEIQGVTNFILNAHFFPRATSWDIGRDFQRWRNVYLNGRVDFGTKVSGRTNTVYMDLDNYDGLRFYVNASNVLTVYDNAIYIKCNFIPNVTNSFDLGSNTRYFNNLYLVGFISDGTNTVSVANIASKVTSTFISGTFDANGEATIDTEQAGTPEGLFIFTYGNCQCFLRLTATMVQNADTVPIRISCPMIYNGATSLGWLNITKAGYILVLTITDGTNHVDSGYAWTLTKTNLL